MRLLIDSYAARSARVANMHEFRSTRCRSYAKLIGELVIAFLDGLGQDLADPSPIEAGDTIRVRELT